MGLTYAAATRTVTN